jgi:hypothetical protein
MQDRVGTEIPSQEQITEALELIQRASELLRPFCIALSVEERKRLLRMRIGGEQVVTDVAAMAERHSLSLPGASPGGMRNDLALAKLLAPVSNAADSFSQLLSDTILEAQSEAWWGTTANYTALARIAGGNPEIEAELKPVVEFFARKRRRRGTPAPE